VTLLVDTGPLYALAVASDQYHARARSDMQRVRAGGHTLLVAYSTLCEGYSLLLRRAKPGAAQSWQAQLRRRAGLIAPTQNDYREAADKVIQYPDQTISLFDGVIAVLGERLKLPIWTFDADFDVMGAEVWR
jgi:predicted nucleic acid-binding protein